MSSTIAKLMTADELLQMPDDGHRYSLVEGELHQMSPAGHEHGWIAANIAAALFHYVKERKLGRVYGAETGFTLQKGPDTVLAPDAAFVRAERVEQSRGTRGYFDGPPDLAVEVLSPDDSKREVAEKVESWLSFGTQEVWVVAPKSKKVTVYMSGKDPAANSESDVLCSRVIPGFEIKVSEIFAE